MVSASPEKFSDWSKGLLTLAVFAHGHGGGGNLFVVANPEQDGFWARQDLHQASLSWFILADATLFPSYYWLT